MRTWLCLLAACAVAAAAPAQEIRLTGGVVERQVLQRNAEGYADLNLTGTATGKKINGKAIEARLVSKGNVVSGFDWASAGQIQKQHWSADVRRIPAGGPYKLELRIEGTGVIVVVDDFLVCDLWLLPWQSYIEGHGDLINVQPPSELIHSFDLADHWVVATEPLHTLVSAVDRVHWALNRAHEPEQLTGDALTHYMSERKKGAGLGLPFAVELFRRTGIPIGLLPCAHGGTSMDQWNPSLKDREGDSLYGSMLRRFRAAGGNIKGMLWYQGESDANPKAAPEFPRKFEDFVKAVRADFNEPNLPFYYVQIGRHIDNKNIAEWNALQSAQLAAESQLQNTGMVACIHCTIADDIHVSTRDLKRLARRLADQASHDLFSRINRYGDLKRGPRPLAAKYEGGVVTVTFASVNGRLETLGRISGFSIHDQKGEPVPLIYKSAIDPAAASSVLLYVGGKLPQKATLRYGFGKDAYCNLHDATDQAVPAFGPLAIQ